MNEPKPKFNVCEPFAGVITVILNESFSRLLQNFIADCEDVEPEIIMLLDALRGNSDINTNNDAFLVSGGYNGISTIQMDERFSSSLRQFIMDVEDVEPEIWAFKQALSDPAASNQIRTLKRMGRTNFRQDDDRGGYRPRRQHR